MRDGFVKVAAATPKIRVADCDYNASEIIRLCREAAELGSFASPAIPAGISFCRTPCWTPPKRRWSASGP